LLAELNGSENHVNLLIVASLDLIGTAFQVKGDFDTARIFFQMNLEAAQRLYGDTLNLSIASALINIAGVHEKEGDLDLAIHQYAKGLKV